jgi:hypothetical protein
MRLPSRLDCGSRKIGYSIPNISAISHPRPIDVSVATRWKMPRTKLEAIAYFDHIHGQGSLSRLLSLLIDSQHTYEAIGRRFGVSKQRIGQLALIMGIDGRQRERQRNLRKLTYSRCNGYSADVLAVIRAIKRLGYEVLPYRPRYRSGKRSLRWTSKQTVLINGVPCRIYCRRHDHGTTGEGRYVQFYAGRWMKGAKVAVLAVIKPAGIKLYVVPVRHLLNVTKFLLPFNGKYAMGRYKKPNRDWTAYENAWQWVKS